MIVAARDIIERGEYKGRRLPAKPRTDGAVAFHWFEANVDLEGKVERGGVTVLEDASGQKFYNINADISETSGKASEKARGNLESQVQGREPLEGAGEPDTFEQSSIPETAGLNITLLGKAGTETAAPRAGVELTDELTRIWLSDNADPSSIIHESGHVFLALLHRLARAEDATPPALHKPRRDGALAFHWFEADVGLGGQAYRVGITVLEDAAGNKFYNLNADLVEWRALRRGGARGLPGSRIRGREPSGGAADPDARDRAPGGDDTLEQPSIAENDALNITLLGKAGGETAAPRAGVELTDELTRIWLSERADASSVIHESGHVFLGLLRRLAEADGAPAAEPLFRRRNIRLFDRSVRPNRTIMK